MIESVFAELEPVVGREGKRLEARAGRPYVIPMGVSTLIGALASSTRGSNC